MKRKLNQIIEGMNSIVANRKAKDYHTQLADYFQSKPLYLDGEEFKTPNVRKLVEQPWQELEAAKAVEIQFGEEPEIEEQRGKLWDNVTNTLCNLDFIQAKAAAKLTYELVNEINIALEVIPDNAEEIAKEKARQARMDKYTQDLISCAEGKMSRFELEVPESITPWTEEQINVEIERIKTNPNRADRLRDFRNFLGQEADNLQNYAYKFAHFAIQQAWNWADEGPVFDKTCMIPDNIKENLILLIDPTRPKWNPFPQLIKVFKGHKGHIKFIATTVDDKYVISTATIHPESVHLKPENELIKWDLKTGVKLNHISSISSDSIVNDFSISADGNLALITTNYGKSINLWDIKRGSLIKSINFIDGIITAISMNPGGKYALCGMNSGKLKFLNLYSEEVINTFSGHTDKVLSVLISQDSKQAVSCGKDNTIIIWNISTGEMEGRLNGHSDMINTIAVTPDFNWCISGSNDKTLILWDLKLRKKIKILNGHNYGISNVDLSIDGRYAASESFDKMIIWDLSSGKHNKTINSSTTICSGVSLICNGINVIKSNGIRSFTILDIQKGHINNEQNIHTRFISDVKISPDHKFVISGSHDSNLITWDIRSTSIIKIFKGQKGSIYSVNLTPDLKYVLSGSSDGSVFLWNIKKGSISKTFNYEEGQINELRLLSTGKHAISINHNNSIGVLDLAKEKLSKNVLNTKLVTGLVATALDISPDNRIAISLIDIKTLLVWNIKTGEKIKIMQGHNVRIDDIIIAPNGKLAITISSDGHIIVWNIKSGMIFNNFKISQIGRNAIRFSADCNHIIFGTWNGEITVLEIKTGRTKSLFLGNNYFSAIDIIDNMIIAGEGEGKINFLKVGKDILNTYFGIITIREIWDLELNFYHKISADCPFCGNRFNPPHSVLKTIEHVQTKAKLTPNQSPCLELPDEAWEHPGLLSECPKCKEKLKFNPFIAGVEDY